VLFGEIFSSYRFFLARIAPSPPRSRSPHQAVHPFVLKR
jgi:hypothetical protein